MAKRICDLAFADTRIEKARQSPQWLAKPLRLRALVVKIRSDRKIVKSVYYAKSELVLWHPVVYKHRRSGFRSKLTSRPAPSVPAR